MATFELKGLKTAGGDETLRFEASLHINGKRAAIISNGGNGGCCRWSWLNDDLEVAFDKHIKELRDQGQFDSKFGNDEDFIYKLMDEVLDRRACKKKTLFLVDGIHYEIKEVYQPKVKAYLLKKYGDRVVILNEKYQ